MMEEQEWREELGCIVCIGGNVLVGGPRRIVVWRGRGFLTGSLSGLIQEKGRNVKNWADRGRKVKGQ